MEKARIRFAPSPTGFLHIGSLRTVLFDYLIAKSMHGSLILRVEDTDQKRQVEGAIEHLVTTLEWFGLKFDEGPHVGGNYGPYIQTQRLDIYKKYADQLLEKQGAYRCFCTPERLETMRNQQAADKLPPRYDRKCRDLTDDEIRQKIANNEKYVIRQKMPLIGEVIVRDELRGEIKFKAVDLDDQVLIKSDGIPTYHFASVVDDHTMEITHVTRGDEWISSFPKNILLYEAFNWIPPKFIHFPLVLNKNGGKLSKRDGDVAVEEYREKGYLVAALINFCALLGWHPKDDNEILSLDEIISKFKYEDMGASPAVFDLEKLDFFNGVYIRRMPLSELTQLCLPYLQKSGLVKDEPKIEMDNMMKMVATVQERMKKISDIIDLTDFYFTESMDYPASLLTWKNLNNESIKENLIKINEIINDISEKDWNKIDMEKIIIGYLKDNSLKVGDYLWPLRVALTGKQASPGPFEVAEVLGKDKSQKRILSALEMLK